MTSASVSSRCPAGRRRPVIGSSASTSRRSGARGPSRWVWPTTSSRDGGASGRRAVQRGRPRDALPPRVRAPRRTARCRSRQLRRYPRGTTVPCSSGPSGDHRQRDRARRDATVDQGGPALAGGGGRGRARGPGRRGDADRHRRRLRSGTRRSSGTTRSWSPARWPPTAATDDVLVATKGGHTRARRGTGGWTGCGLPPRGLRGVAAPAGRRGDRALPVPPARPGHAVGGVDGRAAGRCPTTG